MELASLGQMLDRGGKEAHKLVAALLKSSVTKDWIVKVCTCPLYVDRAVKFVAPVLKKRNTKMCESVICKNQTQALLEAMDDSK